MDSVTLICIDYHTMTQGYFPSSCNMVAIYEHSIPYI